MPKHQSGLVSCEEFERLVQAGAFLEYTYGREDLSEDEQDGSTKAAASDASTARSLLAQCPPLRPPDPTSASGALLEPSGVTFDAIDLVIASGRVPVLALRPQVPLSRAHFSLYELYEIFTSILRVSPKWNSQLLTYLHVLMASTASSAI